ncbi:hypothetical protein ScPMuIL_000724 [Solemya velum]
MGLIDASNNETIFTFLSEFDPHSKDQTVIEVTFLATIFMLALVGNGMILVTLMRSKIWIATNYFIINLAGSNLIFALGIPFIAVTRVKEDWVFGDVACKLITYVEFVCGVSSIITMLAISVERYVCVCTYQNIKMSKTVAGYVIFMSWLMSLCCPVPIALTQTEKHIIMHNRTYVFCGVSWERSFNSGVYLTMMFVLFFVIPLLIISLNYYRIIKLVRNSALGDVSNNKKRIEKSQKRLLEMCISLVLAFVLMCLPFFILSLLGIYYNIITSSQFTATFILVLANTCINPIIYGFFNCTHPGNWFKCKEKECPQIT